MLLINDDTVDDECSFQFPPEAEFTSDNEAESPCFKTTARVLKHVVTLTI